MGNEGSGSRPSPARTTTKAIGYDPGGNGANGVAVVEVDSDGCIVAEERAVVRGPAQAVEWLVRHGKGAAALGIDTMLCWCAGQRPCDRAIRSAYGLPSGSVQSLGSLRGAMIGYGLIVGRAVAERLDVILCEANPKALRRALGQAKLTDDDHAQDAGLAALAAAKWAVGRWAVDLFTTHRTPDGWYPIGEAVYPWPETLQELGATRRAHFGSLGCEQPGQCF